MCHFIRIRNVYRGAINECWINAKYIQYINPVDPIKKTVTVSTAWCDYEVVEVTGSVVNPATIISNELRKLLLITAPDNPQIAPHIDD